mmetsp:Transcript_23841/g.57503  ORF Transcript_23841/g.57503 Transcript_23841/m.57503 type:complete len:220 (+) Transcript_23841:229-888(+)
MRKMAVSGLTPECGACPSASSIAVIPSDQTSARSSYPAGPPRDGPRWHVITSGAIQKGVPMTVRRREAPAPSCAATPKSASLTSPSAPRRRLPAFTSRWIFRRWWRYSSPSHAPASTPHSCSSVRQRPLASITSRREEPAQYSMMIQSCSSYEKEPKYCTMCFESHCRSISISCAISPMSSASGITLTATILFCSWYSALYTLPNEPSPSVSRIVRKGF